MRGQIRVAILRNKKSTSIQNLSSEREGDNYESLFYWSINNKVYGGGLRDTDYTDFLIT